MRQILTLAGLGVVLLTGLGACASTVKTAVPGWNTLDGSPPLVIAHRGACGLLPEHTLEAYRLAIQQGADVIEPDLVMTADGVLIARHDDYLSATTDVAARPEFAARRRAEGDRLDWWVEDFTLAELRTLRAVQPWPDRPQEFNGRYPVPTLEEVLDLAAKYRVRTEPEVKSPGHFAELGLDPLPELVRILRARGLDGEDAATTIQCSEVEFLQRLNSEVDTPLLMLVSPLNWVDPTADPLAPSVQLEQVAGFADMVGPAKPLVISAEGEDHGFIARAHALGLAVHPWTFRDDEPVATDVGIEAELERIYALGADGVFTDFPATARTVRESMTPGQREE